VPDETTSLRFRHLLEQHGLTQAIFNSITGLLEERRLLLRSGTIVGATIIAASLTKNATGTSDSKMKGDPQRPQLAVRGEAAHRTG
jgi:IS5 family transposase